MPKAKKLGIILIVVGFFIPSILYPFTSYVPRVFGRKLVYAHGGVKYIPRLNELEIVLVDGETKNDKIALPYHYVIAVGIVFIFTGIGLIALTGRKKIGSKP